MDTLISKYMQGYGIQKVMARPIIKHGIIHSVLVRKMKNWTSLNFTQNYQATIFTVKEH